MVKKGSGSSKKKNISKKKGVDTQNIAPSPDISEKPPETPKKKPNVKGLLLQQFDVWQPETLFSVSCDEAYYKGIIAPPFVSSTDESEIRRIRSLLFLKFDINTFPLIMPRKEVSIRELLDQKFEAWKPKTLFSVSCDEAYYKSIAAPPFISSTDESEIRRIRSLLFLKFDINTFPLIMPRKEVSIRELLDQKFEAWKPKTLFSVSCDEAYYKGIMPPPFIGATDEKEIQWIKKLLSLNFDINKFPLKMPRKPMSLQELLALKFDTWTPEKLFSVPCDSGYYKGINPPPFIGSTDEKEIQQIKNLLKLQFDINTFPLVIPLPTFQTTESEEGYRPSVRRYEAGSQAHVEYTPPPKMMKQEEKGPEPMEKTMKYFIASVVVVFALIIVSSISNVSNYYLEPKGQSLEVSKGVFAPLGTKQIVRMNGVKAPAPIKDVYTQEEVYPIIFNYFVKKADALLEGEGMPDFAEVKATLNTAMKYALSNENRIIVHSRLNSIDLVVLLYKADIASGKGTAGDLKAAMGYLEKAMKLKLDAKQADLVKQRVDLVKSLMENPKVQAEPTK